MLTNFELKQLKPKLDIVKKPENRVHELTDSNVSRRVRDQRGKFDFDHYFAFLTNFLKRYNFLLNGI